MKGFFFCGRVLVWVYLDLKSSQLVVAVAVGILCLLALVGPVDLVHLAGLAEVEWLELDIGRI